MHTNIMTKKDLISSLSNINDDDNIYFSHPSNDYWRTMIVTPLHMAKPMPVEYSDYHRSLVLAKNYDDDYDDSINDKKVVVIS